MAYSYIPQITEIQRAHEQEKNKLMQYHRAEKESLQMEHSQTVEEKTEQLHYRLELAERQSQEQQDRDAKVVLKKFTRESSLFMVISVMKPLIVLVENV